MCVYILQHLRHFLSIIPSSFQMPTYRLYIILPGRVKQPGGNKHRHEGQGRRMMRQSPRQTAASLLVVLGSGGHTKEMLTMLQGLDTTKYNPVYLVRAAVRFVCLFVYFRSCFVCPIVCLFMFIRFFVCFMPSQHKGQETHMVSFHFFFFKNAQQTLYDKHSPTTEAKVW